MKLLKPFGFRWLWNILTCFVFHNSGAAVGSLLGMAICGFTSEFLTQKLFGIPKEEALENAYNYLGVKCNGTNDVVNTAFRKLCRKHHPDKGGNVKEFYVLQQHMQIIKESRLDGLYKMEHQNSL